MTDLVPSSDIEAIVGADRHPDRHLARAVSAEQTVYILHSRHCLESGIDLRACPCSRALDSGIDLDEWHFHEDQPGVPVVIEDERLVPAALLHDEEVPC